MSMQSLLRALGRLGEGGWGCKWYSLSGRCIRVFTSIYFVPLLHCLHCTAPWASIVRCPLAFLPGHLTKCTGPTKGCDPTILSNCTSPSTIRQVSGRQFFGHNFSLLLEPTCAAYCNPFCLWVLTSPDDRTLWKNLWLTKWNAGRDGTQTEIWLNVLSIKYSWVSNCLLACLPSLT